MTLPRLFILSIICIISGITGMGQIVSINRDAIDADSVRRNFDNRPYFGLYKDNYFIFGTSVGDKPTEKNTNIKFQISVSQRLTKSTLPWNTYLYLFYTQKCFWNIIEESMPMTDLNFNPGIGLSKPLFVKDRFIGNLLATVEHESNGKDGENSRSWNKISFGANIMLDPNFIVHGKFWIPIIDGKHNKDILDYCGIYQMGTSVTSTDKRFGLSVLLTKRKDWKLNYNTTVELSYLMSKRSNQYLFLQYYNGYGEGLLEYNKFHSMLRVGFVIKPRLYSDF